MKADERQKISFRGGAKALAFLLCLVLVFPLTLLVWLEKKLSSSNSVFVTFAQLVSLVPGPLGHYVRAAYYFGVLDECSWETHIGFGTVFTTREAIVHARVSTGVYCVISCATIGSGVRIASRVSIPSGTRQHLDDDGKMADGTWFERVTIGKKSWIGEGAIVLSDIGAESIVSAGAVVLKDFPPYTLVGGNPARAIRDLSRSASNTE